MRTTMFRAALASFICVAVPAAAQQTVPMRNGIPVAPNGIAVPPPLPDKSVVYHTAEGMDIRATVLDSCGSCTRTARSTRNQSPASPR